MLAGRNSEDYYPITWVGRVPIYVTTLLVIIHVLTMVGTTLMMSIPALSPWLERLVFSSDSVLHQYTVWQFVTYAFINQPSIWFAVEMLLLYSFGREIEKFLGRSAFLWLYATLVLAAPMVLTLLGVLGVSSAPLVGSGAIHFAVFVAFVMIYPNAEMFFFRIQAKWIALVLLGIYSLSYLTVHAWTNLGVLWLECACAVLMMRRAGVANAQFESWIPSQPIEDREPPRRRLGNGKKEEKAVEQDLHETINPLLEKISRHGIGSLTKRERQHLEQARNALIEQEKHSHR
jgi:membrane associated rhomboid family serine protease